MPGRRLSIEESRLLKFWTKPPAKFKSPLLKGLTIEGPPALRGIERLRIPFDYPITAICGRNGVGKSTILALAAFSSRRPQDWMAAPWPTRPTRRPPRFTSYAWKDFFFRHADDPPYDGLNIRFSYSLAGDDIEIERRWINGRWRTMPDPGRSRVPTFPSRPIEFVSLARILPPAELQHVRRNFGERRKPLILQLEPKMCAAMSAIFRRTYSNIEIHEVGGVSLARCSTDADYTGFDMGAGENAMIAILARLQRLPEGGLLIVEGNRARPSSGGTTSLSRCPHTDCSQKTAANHIYNSFKPSNRSSSESRQSALGTGWLRASRGLFTNNPICFGKHDGFPSTRSDPVCRGQFFCSARKRLFASGVAKTNCRCANRRLLQSGSPVGRP